MYFEEGVIQEKIKSFFRQVLQNNRLAHAYLFYGKAGSGKTAFALQLAKALNCNNDSNKPCNQCSSCLKINAASHPDVKLIFPVSKSVKEDKFPEMVRQKTQQPHKKIAISGHLNIPIESIRELKKEASYAPYEAKKRTFIISGIEYFSREAANSFLKLLEEPPENLLIILLTNDINSVLATIRSRCQPVMFPNFTDDEIKKIVSIYFDEKQDLTTQIRISQNNVEKIFELLEINKEDYRPKVLEFLRAAASGKWSAINDISDYFVQLRDKNKALEFLNLMMLWISDAQRFFIMRDPEYLSNADMKETISKFADHFKEINYSFLQEQLEQAYRNIKNNMNIGLTIYDLAIKFKDVLAAQKQPNHV